MPLKSTSRKGDRVNVTKLVPGLVAALFALAANLGSATFESGSGAFLTSLDVAAPEPISTLIGLVAIAALLAQTLRESHRWNGAFFARKAAALFALSVSVNAAAQGSAPDDVERLFDWAETTYPEHFPTRMLTLREGPYRYRHYPLTGNYVGVAGTEVYVLGPVGGGPLVKVGELGDFRCRVQPTDCAVAHPTRVFPGALLDSDGRVVVMAMTTPVAGAEPIAGSAASRLPIRGRKVVMSDSGGYVLAEDGTVTMWGAGFDPVTRGLRVAKMVWPERLVDIGRFGSVGLTADGTVLVTTELETVGDEVRVKSVFRVPLDKPVRQFGADSHWIFRDGTVASVVVDVSVPLAGRAFVEPIVGASDVRSVACGGQRCLALRTDGRVLAWGQGPLGDGGGRFQGSASAVVVRGLSSVREVAVMTLAKTVSTSVALHDDGRLSIWGSIPGQSNNSFVDVPLPVFREDLDGVTDLACSWHCLVRRVDGSIWGWGVNQSNELGNFNPPADFYYQREAVQAKGLLFP